MKDLLYHIIPTSLYKELSKSYFLLLESLDNTDPDLIKAVRNGFILTVLIVTTFSFFPGEPMDVSLFHKEHELGEHKDDSVLNVGGEPSRNIFCSRMKFRLLMWVIVIIGGIIILEKSYGFDLVYILSLSFPKETVVVRRMLGQEGI